MHHPHLLVSLWYLPNNYMPSWRKLWSHSLYGRAFVSIALLWLQHRADLCTCLSLLEYLGHTYMKLILINLLLILNFKLNWIRKENIHPMSLLIHLYYLSHLLYLPHLHFDLAVPFLLEDFFHLLVSKSNGSWRYLGAQRSVGVRKTIPHREIIANGSGHNQTRHLQRESWTATQRSSRTCGCMARTRTHALKFRTANISLFLLFWVENISWHLIS